ncbi:uncharacterized protein LOC112083461 [Eutrema salsugineum]|uniref:uncharacterized protein LOC112083461 n=1 Tax=Eutrema salsugineum TaxID=72664 RepID=UPI000CECECED|nr:uncharacterized protein LOC112083461 [Eutrema salsugineum]
MDSSLFPTFQSALIASKHMFCLPPSGLGSGSLFPWLCWSIWKSHNSRLFENRPVSPSETLTKAVSDAWEWQQAQHKDPSTLQKEPSPRPPHLNHGITCFTYEAWRSDTKSAGYEWIFLNSDGSEILKDSGFDPHIGSPLMVEAIALRSALLQGLDMGFTSLTIKSDAQILIRAISSQKQTKEVYDLLFDIQALASMFSAILFCFIPISENDRVDSLAKLALCNS